MCSTEVNRSLAKGGYNAAGGMLIIARAAAHLTLLQVPFIVRKPLHCHVTFSIFTSETGRSFRSVEDVRNRVYNLLARSHASEDRIVRR